MACAVCSSPALSPPHAHLETQLVRVDLVELQHVAREREGKRGRERERESGGRGAGRREEKRREVNGERERRGGESVVWRSEGARERILQ